MELPRYHEQPVLLLMYRTIQNLEFIDRSKQHHGPFEVTQLINSFLAVVAHPWDRLLDQRELKKLAFGSKAFMDCGFPTFPILPVEGKPAVVDNAYDLLRVLRNGLAHGNMELLGRKELRELRQKGPLPRVREDEIAGIKLWNRKSDSEPINWCTAGEHTRAWIQQEALIAVYRLLGWPIMTSFSWNLSHLRATRLGRSWSPARRDGMQRPTRSRYTNMVMARSARFALASPRDGSEFTP